MEGARLPLDRIRVLDITVVWAGPYATQLLADWGAEVIRIEPIAVFQTLSRGAHARVTKEEVLANPHWGAAFPGWEPGPRPWNRHPSFNVHARNKMSMTLNVHHPKGGAVLDELVSVSDVLLENNVPPTAEKLGLSYERLRKINPTLVVVRMPGFGLEGPYRDYRCLGSHIDGVTGHTMVRGYSDLGIESKEDVFFSDAAGGVNGALAALMGLRHRNRTGRGQLIELAQVENYSSYVSDVTIDYLMNRRVQSGLGNRHHSMAPHGCYPCEGDDQWVVIGVSSEGQWDGLCRAMGNPAWTRDRRFSSVLARWKNQDDLDGLISVWTGTMPKRKVMEVLQKQGVPAGAVLNQPEVFQDPQFRDRRFFQAVTHPETGTHEYPSMIARMSRTPNEIRLPPPLLGEHNEYVYKGILGFTNGQYREMEEAGHIGMDYAEDVP